jgi:phosphotriesterase-related protein
VAQVPTVTGPIDTADLGTTLMHEHIFVLDPDVTRNWPGGWDEEEQIQRAHAKLAELKSAGIDTIVDLTVVGVGRDVARVQRVAAGTGLRVIVATGLYTFNEVPLPFRLRGPGTRLGGDEPMVELFVRDIQEGIAGTGVRAGILKCATDQQGVTPGVERVLRAVAQAHLRTGVPITTHTHAASRQGLAQQRILAEEGVDLSRVVIGHCGDTIDLDYLEELAAAGSWLGMDRFGLDNLLPLEARVRTVAAMCERGHAGRMVLSQDANCFIDWLPQELVSTALPNWHYLHLLKDVVPTLQRVGVTDEQVQTMLVDNPRRIFEQQGTV